MSSTAILFVDDDDIKRYVACHSLRNAGYEVIEATRAETALELIYAASPRLVITDIRLLDMDGYELCRRVRQYDRRIPVLLVSAHIPNQSKIDECGAEDFIEGYDSDTEGIVKSVKRILKA